MRKILKLKLFKIKLDNGLSGSWRSLVTLISTRSQNLLKIPKKLLRQSTNTLASWNQNLTSKFKRFPRINNQEDYQQNKTRKLQEFNQNVLDSIQADRRFSMLMRNSSSLKLNVNLFLDRWRIGFN